MLVCVLQSVQARALSGLGSARRAIVVGFSAAALMSVPVNASAVDKNSKIEKVSFLINVLFRKINFRSFLTILLKFVNLSRCKYFHNKFT